MKDYMTPTGIASFVYCPRLCYLNKVFPYSGKKTERTVLGLFEHDVLAKHSELSKIDLSNVKALTEKELDLNKDRISRVLNFAIKISKENYPQFLDVLTDNLPSLKLRLSFLDEFRFKKLFSMVNAGMPIKEAVDVVLPWDIETRFFSSKYNIRGRADAIYKTLDNTLIVEDIKSHDQRLDAFIHKDEHKAQLTVYAVCAEEKYRMPVNQGQIFYSQDLSIDSFHISEDDKFDIIETKKEAQKVTESEIPPKLEGDKAIKCKFCYKRKLCFSLDQRTDDIFRIVCLAKSFDDTVSKKYDELNIKNIFFDLIEIREKGYKIYRLHQ